MILRAFFAMFLMAAVSARLASPVSAVAAARLAPVPAFYSGSFDPPTTAHLKIIREIAGSGVKKLVVIVNQSGVKDFKASSGERIDMLKAALADLGDKVEFVSVPQSGKNQLIQSMTEHEPYFYQFIGDDSFEKLPNIASWSGRQRWMVLPRNGMNAETKKMAEHLGAGTFPVQVPEAASSTQLRAELAKGIHSSPLLDPKVGAYIRAGNLYRPLPPELAKAQEGIFHDAFREFLKNLKVAAPEFDGSGIPPPPFEPLQSRQAWAEKFMNWVIDQKKLTGADEAAFRKAAARLLYASNKGRDFARLAFLAQVSEGAGPVTPPRISSVIAEAPSTVTAESTLDLRDYASQRFPEPVQKLLAGKKGSIYLHTGTTEESLAFHRAQGFTELYKVELDKGNPNTRNYLARNPATGEYRLVAPTLGTEDRFAQVKGQVDIFSGNTPVFRVTHETPAPAFAFNEAGSALRLTARDKVVIGFRNVVFEKYGKDPAWKFESLSKQGIEIGMYTNVRTGERIVNPRNVYGDEMKQLLQTFYDKGARDFALLGTSGTIDPSIRIGDVVVPRTLTIDGGATFMFPNSADSLLDRAGVNGVHTNVHHGWVQTILRETPEHAKEMQKSGIQSVDIEGRYLAEFLRDRKDVKGSLILFISDEPLAATNYVAANGTLPKVQDSVKRTLGGFFEPQAAFGCAAAFEALH